MPQPSELYSPNGLLLDDTPLARRPLTAVERYHLARRTLSSPYTITYLITYPSPSALPDEAGIRLRIMELQDHFALLDARIRLSTSNDARDGPGRGREQGTVWEERLMLRPSSQIFSRHTYPQHRANGGTTEGGQTGDQGHTDPVEEWILNTSEIEWQADEPLWRVRFHTSEVSEADACAYMSISVAHELMDGIGLTRLVRALLADSADDLPYEALLRDAGEGVGGDTSWTGWFSRAQELISSVMPAAQSFTAAATFPCERDTVPDHDTTLPAPASWPTGRLSANYTSLPHRIALHRLPATLIQSLKSLSLYHGIPILTPVLQVAFLAAVQAVHQCPTGQALTSVIPFSERDAARGDEWCTGQYTPAHLFDLDLGGICAHAAAGSAGEDHGKVDAARGQEASQDEAGPLFWAEARRLAYRLAHPEYRAIARANLEKLDTLTAPPNDTTARDPFVIHLERQAASDKPYPQSVSFSNIGKVELPPGAMGVVIAGTCAIGDPPYEVVLSGMEEKGLVAAVAYKDGDVAEEVEVRRVLVLWEEILKGLLVDGKEVRIVEAIVKAV